MSTNNTAPAKGDPIRDQNGPNRKKGGQDYMTKDKPLSTLTLDKNSQGTVYKSK